MDVKRQTCQACQSIDVRNIIVRDGREQVIYVRCAKCKQLVARYQLNDYYHHGKGIESYLRARGATGGDSGRAWLDAFKKSQEKAVSGYEEALTALESAHKAV
jgi:RNase P subunit RPR2